MTTTSTLSDGILYLTLSGDLIGSPYTQQLLQAVNDCLGEAVTNCAVDLSDINSTGLGGLIALLTKFRRGGEMVFINPADYFQKLLALTELTNISAVAADQATARQQLAATC